MHGSEGTRGAGCAERPYMMCRVLATEKIERCVPRRFAHRSSREMRRGTGGARACGLPTSRPMQMRPAWGNVCLCHCGSRRWHPSAGLTSAAADTLRAAVAAAAVCPSALVVPPAGAPVTAWRSPVEKEGTGSFFSQGVTGALLVNRPAWRPAP